ncbi:L-fucose isomerase-like protein [Bacteroides zoogleoformans]|uniref:Fucose isomerase n=1 Tax=Bacteroides zoogleoformans TaxID=28119 RepID=A0ABM6T6D5_9BACE|nr:fucose isomerase [Bacteroides zoogleoformans]AVM52320.1 fucose isomerase [Bacteroides zoogleoformans]TWJ11207.1 L-fucose isomerase-like protein [Bacteroides zoogleoformans]
MVINLIAFASILHKQTTVRNSHEVILTELEKYFTVNIIDYQNLDQLSSDDFSILFIATGGVERLVIQHFESLPRPAILLADGMQNSLAAALEISSWLRGRGMKSEILHGELSEIVKRIFVLHSNFMAQRNLSGTRVGVIGTPAGWLVASNVDYLLAKRRWGIEYTDIPLERVYEYYEQITDDEVGQACADLAGKALVCREATPEDLVKAMRLYRAVKRIVTEERLNAITLSCFRLIEQTGTTGCLALALLNDEGIVAGCEGDLQSVFSMLAVKALTGKGSFMANPSMINTRSNEIILTHCSIGITQTEKFIIRNHFETESGISIQGILPTGDVTIVKCGSESLDEYYLTTGTLIENTNYINMCRTQVRVKLDSSTDYFLKTPLGNHHIMLHGNYEDVLNEFLQANGCKRIE